MAEYENWAGAYHKVGKGKELEDMLANAIEDEDKAGSLYDKMARIAEKKGKDVSSAVFKMIAEQERSHNKALKKIKEVL